MAKKLTPKQKQQLQAENGFGDIDHPLLGDDPNQPRPPSSQAFDPEGRVMEMERRAAMLDETEQSTEAVYNLGPEATVIQIATSPDVWIVESNGEAFTFNGDVYQFLAERGVVAI